MSNVKENNARRKINLRLRVVENNNLDLESYAVGNL